MQHTFIFDLAIFFLTIVKYLLDFYSNIIHFFPSNSVISRIKKVDLFIRGFLSGLLGKWWRWLVIHDRLESIILLPLLWGLEKRYYYRIQSWHFVMPVMESGRRSLVFHVKAAVGWWTVTKDFARKGGVGRKAIFVGVSATETYLAWEPLETLSSFGWPWKSSYCMQVPSQNGDTLVTVVLGRRFLPIIHWWRLWARMNAELQGKDRQSALSVKAWLLYDLGMEMVNKNVGWVNGGRGKVGCLAGGKVKSDIVDLADWTRTLDRDFRVFGWMVERVWRFLWLQTPRTRGGSCTWMFWAESRSRSRTWKLFEEEPREWRVQKDKRARGANGYR